MPVNDRSDYEKSEKSFTTQTVRVPKDLLRLMKYRMADTDEGFQEFAMRLIRQEIEQPAQLSEPKAPPTASEAADTRETYGIPRADWHRMLDQVLDSPARHLVIAIVTNLLAFGRDAETIGMGKPGKRAGNYEEYEARVLAALAHLCGDQDQQLVRDVAAFLSEADPGTKELVLEQIDLWKAEKANREMHEKKPKAAPPNDPPEKSRTSTHPRRKTV